MSARAWLIALAALAIIGGIAVTAIPRGIRNHNPMNVRRTRDAWRGLRVEQTDPEYFQFVDAAHGLRAGGIVLLNYFGRYGLNTVRKIIARFAPEHENPTDAYIANVARRLNVGPDEPIDVHARLLDLMRAIVTQENGAAAAAKIPAAAYDEALRLISQRNV